MIRRNKKNSTLHSFVQNILPKCPNYLGAWCSPGALLFRPSPTSGFDPCLYTKSTPPFSGRGAFGWAGRGRTYDVGVKVPCLTAWRQPNISKSELCRCFKKVLHKTPFEYLIRYRVIQACSLLKNTDCSVTEAASFTGFDSISHMGRFFHKYLKQSPSHYKKS